ncbi:hypothetical protein FOZ62_002695, partial [Perkinsus olseni]
PVNAMRLCNTGAGVAWLPNSMVNPGTSSGEARIDLKQHQASAAEILRSVPAECTRWFGKLDLSNAFYSIEIPSAIRGLFCTRSRAPDGTQVFWRLTRLPQGWTLSPIYFARAVQYVLSLCEAQRPSSVVVRNYQDDVLICGKDKSSVEQFMATVVAKLEELGFTVNPSKCVGPVTSISFCGFILKDGLYSPDPKMGVYTAKSAESAFAEMLSYVRNRSERQLAWVRSWVGRFNFFRGWLSPERLRDLHSLCGYIKPLQRGVAVSDKDRKLREAFLRLCSDVFNNRILPLAFGQPGPRTLGTIVCTDANLTSWSGIVLRVEACDEHESTGGPSDRLGQDLEPDNSLYEAMGEVIVSLKSLPEFEGKNLRLVPVRVTGGVWTIGESRQSSTWRERAAQLLCIEEARVHLTSPTVIVSDNQNVGKQWHEVEDVFGGKWASMVELYMRTVTHRLWVRRDGLPALADAFARFFVSASPTGRSDRVNGGARWTGSSSELNAGSQVDLQMVAVDFNPALVDVDDDVESMGLDVSDSALATESSVYSDSDTDIVALYDSSGSHEGADRPMTLREVIEHLEAYFSRVGNGGFLDEVRRAQSVDSSTSYMGLKVKDVIQFLITADAEGVAGDDRSKQKKLLAVSKRFFLRDGLLFYHTYSGFKLYIPRAISGAVLKRATRGTGPWMRSFIISSYHDTNT